MQRDARRILEQTKQTQSDVVQLDNLTQRVNAVILRVQRDKASMAAIAYVNGFNCRRAIGDGLPDANTGQLLAGTLRQGNSAGIKTGMIFACGAIASTRCTGSCPFVKCEMASASVAPVMPPPTIITLMRVPLPSAPQYRQRFSRRSRSGFRYRFR